MIVTYQRSKGSGPAFVPSVLLCLGYCLCCGSVVRATRLIDTDLCPDCLVWSLRIQGVNNALL